MFEFLVAAFWLGAAQRGPEPTNVREWIATEDYPADAYERRESGVVRAMLRVSDKGVVQNCEIRESSGSPSLDAAACDLVTERARFRPAIGQDGQFVSSDYPLRVNWEFPWPIRIARVGWRERIDLHIDPQGDVKCNSVRDGPMPTLLSMCDLFAPNRKEEEVEVAKMILSHGSHIEIDTRLSFDLESPTRSQKADGEYLSWSVAQIDIEKNGEIARCSISSESLEQEGLQLCDAADSIIFEPVNSNEHRDSALLFQSIRLVSRSHE